MFATRHIDWRVEAGDLAKRPLGYRVDLSLDPSFLSLTDRRSSFARLGDFLYSPSGEESALDPFPFRGVPDPVEGGLVRLSLRGSAPAANLVVASGSSVRRLAAGGAWWVGEASLDPVAVRDVSVDVTNNDVWLLCEGQTVVVLDRFLAQRRWYRAHGDAVAIAVDGPRRRVWEVCRGRAVLRSADGDMGEVADMALPTRVSAVTSKVVCRATGDLFAAVSSRRESMLHCAQGGVQGALYGIVTGLGEWEAGSVLVADGTASVAVYDGTLHPGAINLAGQGFFPSRLASSGGGDIYAVDQFSRVVAKVAPYGGWVSWRHAIPGAGDPTAIDLASESAGEEDGRRVYFWWDGGVGAVEDAGGEPWPLGTAEVAWPFVAAQQSPHAPGHVHARVVPLSVPDVAFRESSSSTQSASEVSSSTPSSPTSPSSSSFSDLSASSTSSPSSVHSTGVTPSSESSSRSSFSTSSMSSVKSESTSRMLLSSSSSWSSFGFVDANLLEVDDLPGCVTASGYVDPHLPWWAFMPFDGTWTAEAVSVELADRVWIEQTGAVASTACDSWIAVDFSPRQPAGVQMTAYWIMGFGLGEGTPGGVCGGTSHLPTKWYVDASMDGTTWTQVDAVDLAASPYRFTPPSMNGYTYIRATPDVSSKWTRYRWRFERVAGLSTCVGLARIRVAGTT